MTTVFSRTLRSVPFRSASDTWQLLIGILTAAGGTVHRAELARVRGIAAALIAEKSPQDAPIVVLGGGPRVRIYCLYDESALEGESDGEAPLSFNPFEGDWSLSLPCPAEDLTWVTAALKGKSARVSARDAAEGIEVPLGKASNSTFELNVDEFMKP